MLLFVGPQSVLDKLSCKAAPLESGKRYKGLRKGGMWDRRQSLLNHVESILRPFSSLLHPILENMTVILAGNHIYLTAHVFTRSFLKYLNKLARVLFYLSLLTC